MIVSRTVNAIAAIRCLAAAIFLLGAAPSASAQAQAASTAASGPYAPYESLIGVWDVNRDGGPVQLIERFTWAGGGSYISFSAATIENGVETPHFEGVLMWNGVSRRLDMLVMLDLTANARVLETGSLTVQPDGSFVRDIVAYYSEGTPRQGGATVGREGAQMVFRQTFTPIDHTHMRTSVMRRSGDGWTPTFPGSDNFLMTRRA